MTAALHAGYATTTTINVLVIQDIGSNATVVCNGTSYSVPVAAVGDDVDTHGDRYYLDVPQGAIKVYPGQHNTELCFSGAVEITGLSPLTRYDMTCSNAQISAMTAPEDDDDFTLFLTTCMAVPGQSFPQGPLTTSEGVFPYIKAYVENPNTLPVPAWFNFDDTLYVDQITAESQAMVYNSAQNKGPLKWVGIFSPAPALDTEYNYALSWCWPYYDLFPCPNTLEVHDNELGWCYKNVNLIPQWGDHEFWNDIGIDDGGPAEFPTEFAMAKSAWNAFMGKLHPTPINATNSNAWAIRYGPVQIFTMDRCTNASNPAVSPPLGLDETEGPVLGTAQVDDILATVAADDAPFKIFGTSLGIRYTHPENYGVTGRGGQQPMMDMGTLSLAEYNKLMTDAGGLLDLGKGNGSKPFTLALAQGDWHNGLAQLYEGATGTHAEDFHVFCLGTATGSQNRIEWDNTILEGDSAHNITYKYIDPRLQTLSPTAQDIHDSWCCQVDVFGSRTPKQMSMSMVDNGTMEKQYTVWFEEGKDGNYSVVPRARVELT